MSTHGVSVHEAILLTRDQFRDAVFARDKQLCAVCQAPAVDAHHLIERRLWSNGGYYLGNGVSLCAACHLKAESTELSCELLRAASGIEHILLPPHLYPDTRYDKWGNAWLEDGSGRRYTGECYFDESVAKVLANYGDPRHFVSAVKFPRTFHLSWSPGGTKDDRVLAPADEAELLASPIVVTAKMDGESCSMYPDRVHARSLDDSHADDRTWVKNLWAQIRQDIPPGWRVCGENLFARHALYYDDLPTYFMVHSIWTERNECLSWADTELWASLLGLQTVPVVYRGVWRGPETTLNRLAQVVHRGADQEGHSTHEGYVVRTQLGFLFRDYRRCVGKYVRADHVVEHGRHWRRRAIEKNGLKR